MIRQAFVCVALALLSISTLPALGSPRLDAAEKEAQVPATWPGWRGVSRDGRVAGEDWPETLAGDALEKVWSTDLGPSYSGPIVTEDRVFVTETAEKKEEVVRAFDRATGKELWETRWEGAMKVPFFASSNGSWIRSTPAWDGEHLYVAGMRDVLACIEGKTGSVKWRVDFAERFGSSLPSFGFVCSPLVDEQHVYVQAGGGFVKVDKKTGETAWRTLDDGGGMFGSAFSSPAFASIGGERQILVQTRTKIAGVRIDDGGILWEREIPAFRGMNILPPTPVGDRVFTSSYGGGSFALDVAPGQPGAEPAIAWKDSAQGYMSSPVVFEGHVYLHLRNQRIACLRLADGKRMWTSKERYGKYMSMVAQGDRILALDQRGMLLLMRADPKEFRMLETREISESPTWAHLAVCGDELYVRSLGGLTVYRWQSFTETRPGSTETRPDEPVVKTAVREEITP